MGITYSIQSDKSDDFVSLKKTFVSRVSAFQDVWSKKAKLISLAQWLKSTIQPATDQEKKRCELVERIRSEMDANQKRELKKQLPAITPGASFYPNTERSKGNIKEVTRWVQIDIDLKDNPHLPDAPQLRQAISYNPYIAFCGLSVSGNGVWGLIKVDKNERYHEHFDQLVKDFDEAGIILDTTKGRNPHDLRFYSYDPDAFVNPDFKVYDRIRGPKPVKKSVIQTPKKSFSNNGVIYKAVELIESSCTDITTTYDAWFQCGCAIANELGEEGREYFHAISQFHPDYDPHETDVQFNYCLNGYDYTIGTFLDWCKKRGIYIKDHFSIRTREVPRQKTIINPESQNIGEGEYYFTSIGQKVWDPSGLLRLSGLDFLCDYETEAESTFEDMAIKNPKLFRLRNKLGLKPDE